MTLLNCGGRPFSSSISNSVFMSNTASQGFGGAVRSQGCPATPITNSTFRGNTAGQVWFGKTFWFRSCYAHQIGPDPRFGLCCLAGWRSNLHVRMPGYSQQGIRYQLWWQLRAISKRFWCRPQLQNNVRSRAQWLTSTFSQVSLFSSVFAVLDPKRTQYMCSS